MPISLETSLGNSLGTDLDIAYAGLNDDKHVVHAQAPQQQRTTPIHIVSASANVNTNAKPTPTNVGHEPTPPTSSPMVYSPKVVYDPSPPAPVMAPMAANVKYAAVETYAEDPTYLDKMWNKKKDMGKVVGFALVIVFAIAVYSVFEFWVKDFVAASLLTHKQELGLRLLFPILLLFIMWNLKALR